MIDRLKNILSGLAEGYGRLVEMSGEADHIHFLVELNPKASPSVIANNWKTVTSRLLRRDFGAELEQHYENPVLWSRSYFVSTCGGAPLSVIKQYIESQERSE
jgi:putative transposase